jgi:hypothetical protein
VEVGEKEGFALRVRGVLESIHYDVGPYETRGETVRNVVVQKGVSEQQHTPRIRLKSGQYFFCPHLLPPRPPPFLGRCPAPSAGLREAVVVVVVVVVAVVAVVFVVAVVVEVVAVAVVVVVVEVGCLRPELKNECTAATTPSFILCRVDDGDDEGGADCVGGGGGVGGGCGGRGGRLEHRVM